MPAYAIRAGESGPVKIGWSADVPNRLIKMQADNHERLRVLRLWEGGIVEEAMLHILFADLHLRGEWYSYSRLMLGDVGLKDIPLVPWTTPLAALHQTAPTLSTNDAVLGDEVTLRHLVRKSGISQRAIAFRLAVCEATVSKWIKGTQRMPGDKVCLVAAALKVPPEVVLRATRRNRPADRAAQASAA